MNTFSYELLLLFKKKLSNENIEIYVELEYITNFVNKELDCK